MRHDAVFDDAPDESSYFASQTVAFLAALIRDRPAERYWECGSGDGSHMSAAIRRAIERGFLPPDFVLNGVEISLASARQAKEVTRSRDVATNYPVRRANFFKLAAKDTRRDRAYLMADPPFVPGRRPPMRNKGLWGGPSGAEFAMGLLDLGFRHQSLLLASVANPWAVIDYGLWLGYRVIDFSLSPLRFGIHTSDTDVQAHVRKMVEVEQAFILDEGLTRMFYGIGCVVFTKDDDVDDLSRAAMLALSAVNTAPTPDIDEWRERRIRRLVDSGDTGKDPDEWRGVIGASDGQLVRMGLDRTQECPHTLAPEAPENRWSRTVRLGEPSVQAMPSRASL